jgi:UDP-N-acetylglucosamine 4-epimerase
MSRHCAPAEPRGPDIADGSRRTALDSRRRWLVTGSAGFIGSHLLEALLEAGQDVISLDNFATGHPSNLDEVRSSVGEVDWERHRFIEGDITDPEVLARACDGVEIVMHQAALGSVPRSVGDPLETHRANATGFLNVLVAARQAGCARVVYAGSSATYGDSAALPKVEDRIGHPLSPYAVTKYVDELYADVFARCYGLPAIGLRYFNVFGARQDPQGSYAAVIPRWAAAILGGRPCVINGDGETSRDFCFIANAVQANVRAALVENPAALNRSQRRGPEQTTLKDLHRVLLDALRSGPRPRNQRRRNTQPFGSVAGIPYRHRQGPQPPGLCADARHPPA